MRRGRRVLNLEAEVFKRSELLSGVVHTRVEVCRMDSEMSRLVE